MKLIAQHTVMHGKGTAYAGDAFELSDEKEIRRLLALGAVRPASPDLAAASDAGESGGSGKNDDGQGGPP